MRSTARSFVTREMCSAFEMAKNVVSEPVESDPSTKKLFDETSPVGAPREDTDSDDSRSADEGTEKEDTAVKTEAGDEKKKSSEEEEKSGEISLDEKAGEKNEEEPKEEKNDENGESEQEEKKKKKKKTGTRRRRWR